MNKRRKHRQKKTENISLAIQGDSSAELSARHTKLFYLSILTLFVSITWGVSLWNGFVWDDRPLIVENTAATSPSFLIKAFTSDFWFGSSGGENKTGYYRPITAISYLIDRYIYGLNPVGFHLTNIILHVANVLLLFTWLNLLGLGLITAFVSALIFGINSTWAETVAWISGRTDSLALFFILATLIFQLLQLRNTPSSNRYRYLGYLAFGCALLSKETAIVLPALTYITLQSKQIPNPIKIALSRPYIIIFVAWFLLRELAIGFNFVDASRIFFSLKDAAIFFLHITGALLWYPQIRIEYGHTLPANSLIPGALIGLAIWLVALVCSQRGSSLARTLVNISLILCVPSLLAIYLKSVVATRLMYAPGAFLIAALIIGFKIEMRSGLSKGALGFLVLILASVSIVQAKLWRSDTTLFSAALRAPYPSTRVNLNLGIALYDSGELLEAKKNISFTNDSVAADQRGYMLGLLYTVTGCEQLAEDNYKTALASNPRYQAAITNLVGLLATQGRAAEIQAILTTSRSNKALEERALNRIGANVSRAIRPDTRPPKSAPWCASDSEMDSFLSDPERLTSRGTELASEGQREMAGLLFTAAYKLAPTLDRVAARYAEYLFMKGERMRALEVLRSVLRSGGTTSHSRQILEAISQKRV